MGAPMAAERADAGSRRGVERRRPWLRGLLIGAGLLTLFVVALAGVGALWAFTILPQSLPSVTALEKLEPLKGTKIYDENDELLTELHVERRIFVPLAQCPQALQDAVIATEDRRFYSPLGRRSHRHRARHRQNYRRGRIVEGGSTITQQLAKVLFLTPDKSLERKLKEAILALEIERRYSKDRILEMYLNQVYFGQGAYGVEAAARTYFGKSVSEVTAREAALLAGLPTRPVRPTAPSTTRRRPSSGARSCCARWSSSASLKRRRRQEAASRISASFPPSGDARPASTSSITCSRPWRRSTAPTWSSRAGSACTPRSIRHAAGRRAVVARWAQERWRAGARKARPASTPRAPS